MQSLVNGGLGIEREGGVNLSGDLAGDDLENLLAELNQKAVEGVVDLAVDVATLLLAVLNGAINEGGVLGLLRGSENQGGVGGGILRLVLANGYTFRSVSSFLLRTRKACGSPESNIWLVAVRFLASESTGMAWKRGILTGKVTY